MSTRLMRIGFAMFVVPAATLAILAGALVEAADPAARYSATTVNINPGNTATSDTVKIDVIRWSTDAERDQLMSGFADEKQFFDALQKQPNLGYVWTSASVGFTLRYAYRVAAAGGTDRVVLVTDRRLHSGGPRPWTATVQPSSHDYPFTLIELRLSSAGGEGKMSLAGAVAIDAAAKTLALEDYAAGPLALRAVKRE